MAYDEDLADRVRHALGGREDVDEKAMFGGIAFMRGGKMFVGIVKEDLMVRVGPAAYADALERPHAREMDFTGKPMRGYVFVGRPGTTSVRSIEPWVTRALAFVETLKKTPSPRRQGK